MTHHPGDDILVLFADPTSPLAGPQPRVETAAEADRQHVEQCGRCSARVAEFRAVIWALRSPALAEAPESWMETALERVRELEAANVPASASERLKAGLASMASRAREIVEEIAAGLVLDSHAGALLPGIRGRITSAPRQLLYESNAGQVHVMIEPAGRGRFTLGGQFLPLDGVVHPGARAIAVTSGREVVAQLEPTGEFHLRDLAEGELVLFIENASVRIRLTAIHLPPGDDI